MMYILYTILGGIARRALGGALQWPRGITMTILATLAGVIAYPETGIVLAAGIAASTVVFWALGHGSYMDMGLVDEPDNERFAPWLDKWFGVGSTGIARDFAGMSIRYAIPLAPITIMYIVAGNYYAILLPVVGIFIAITYLVLSIYKDFLPLHNKWLDGYTGYSEIISGMLFYGALSLLTTM